jgi:phosphoribosylglycinamide formyltransferase 2
LKEPGSDIRIFGKPATRPNRRMAVALVSDKPGADVQGLIDKVKTTAAKIILKY